MSHSEHLSTLRFMLAGLFDARYRGAVGSSHAKAQGLVDGYARALVDLQVATDRELLGIVNEERDAAARRADIQFDRHSSIRPQVAAHFA